MPLTLSPSARYDMPASFGPSVIPARTEIEHAEALVLSCPTSHAACAPLLPSHFTVPESPVLSISHMSYKNVDYLGGRSYNEVVVSIGARHGYGDDTIDAPLALVLWVDQPGALIAGREFMGLPKLLGHISDLQDDGDGKLRFDCREYDAVLLDGSVEALAPLESERKARLNTRAGEVRTFGWKYLAKPGGGADLDCPLINTMRWSYREAWTGRGAFAFHPVNTIDAPLSAAAVTALAALPQEGEVRVFRGVGRATIDRTATRRLDSG